MAQIDEEIENQTGLERIRRMHETMRWLLDRMLASAPGTHKVDFFRRRPPAGGRQICCGGLIVGSKSLIVVGAGMGGLSAACYARLSGFDVKVFEAHNLPGGMCTSWKRSGYTFDGSIHHLAGCHPASPIYGMWEELGAMPRELVFSDHLTQVEDPDGRTVTVYTDLNRLEDHLQELFPADGRWIRQYTSALNRMVPHDLLELPLTGYGGLLQHATVLPTLLRWGRVTMRAAAEKLTDPFFKAAFPVFQYAWPDIPALIHLNLLAQCVGRNYAFPVGGSLPFAQSIAARFADLGGEIAYGARVTRILIERGRAAGVVLEDGSEHRADAVISNAFERKTTFDLLGGAHMDKALRARMAEPQDNINMGTHICLGVDRDLTDEPHALVLLLEEPVQLADQMIDRLPIELFGQDPSLAPEGKGAIKVLLNASYRFWRDLHDDRAAYADAKAELAQRVAELLDRRFPGLCAQVEVADVATPVTTERFTGNERAYGVAQGFDPGVIFSRPRSSQEIRRLFWVGQSAGGAGIPGCAAQGRGAVKLVCKELGTRFGGRKL